MNTYNECLTNISADTLASIRQYLEEQYQRDDFDLLEWADADEVAAFILTGALIAADDIDGIEPQDVDDSPAKSAVQLADCYLDGDSMTGPVHPDVIYALTKMMAERAASFDTYVSREADVIVRASAMYGLTTFDDIKGILRGRLIDDISTTLEMGQSRAERIAERIVNLARLRMAANAAVAAAA